MSGGEIQAQGYMLLDTSRTLVRMNIIYQIIKIFQRYAEHIHYLSSRMYGEPDTSMALPYTRLEGA